MTPSRITTQNELIEAIDSAWEELGDFLSTLTEEETRLRDNHGWCIADHVSHMAAWEESVSILFNDRPRHEAFGVKQTYALNSSLNELNERIRELRGEITLEEAADQLREAHQTLLEHLATLNEEDLQRNVIDFFPAAQRRDTRQVISLIYANTAHHFSEHLAWMRILVGRASHHPSE